MKSTQLLYMACLLCFYSCSGDKSPQGFAYQNGDYPISKTDSLINQDYETRIINLEDDYEGKTIATLLRSAVDSAARGAVLYIHGYGDYFFQHHEAQWFNEQGYDFYALELRKYGRSLLPHQHPNFARSLTEYYEEISEAIRLIREEDAHEFLILNGHSTGALTSSLYAHEGTRRQQIDALLLNSPFFDFNISKGESALMRLVNSLAGIYPYGEAPSGKGLYGYTIHQKHGGDWDYNFTWKPIDGFPVYYGWLRAVSRAHRRVQQGLDIAQPILVQH